MLCDIIIVVFSSIEDVGELGAEDGKGEPCLTLTFNSVISTTRLALSPSPRVAYRNLGTFTDNSEPSGNARAMQMSVALNLNRDRTFSIRAEMAETPEASESKLSS